MFANETSSLQCDSCHYDTNINRDKPLTRFVVELVSGQGIQGSSQQLDLFVQQMMVGKTGLER